MGSADVPQTDVSTEWFEYLSTDPAYLRELIIMRLPLPWTIPPHQKLTCLIVKYTTIPVNISIFLSHCPLLNELEIDLLPNIQTDVSTAAPVTSQTLDFPYLKKLKLCAGDLRSFECILEVSSRITIPPHLLLLRVTYIPPSPESPSKLFELVPTGTLSHFKDQRFLSIILPPQEPTPIFIFCIEAERTWELLTSWNIDFSILFPHLTSLELYDRVHEYDHFERRLPYRDCTDCLTALSAFPNVNLHTLILKEVVVNSSILPGVALKIGVQCLRLEDTYVELGILATLSGKGVGVIVVDEDKNLFSPICPLG
ncbi:hypothetical protein Clacol_005056 [Clathrus columnatus]|uniref:Uncharacterized protein n=1 Tax=Clathrus columnatus TaxID=1419009 RepID=A0AAV5ADU7_9AGAM|nr:hypothetical protein Clacol_005056 [Clathrus columnatus]